MKFLCFYPLWKSRKIKGDTRSRWSGKGLIMWESRGIVRGDYYPRGLVTGYKKMYDVIIVFMCYV